MKKKPHPIKVLIAEGEHQKLDFKFEISDAARIARSLVAFANTEGGKLLIGVKDNGTIRGIQSEEEKYMLEYAASHYCRPTVKFTTREWEMDDKVVLEVDIPFSEKSIHKAPDNDGKFKAYVRVKDQNLLASGVLLKVWDKRKRHSEIRFAYSAPAQDILSHLREKGSISLERSIEITGLNKNRTEHLISDLIQLGVLSLQMDGLEETYILQSRSEEFGG